MNENENNTQIQIADVPYIVFEGELARAERHVKRLWIALIIAICVIFVSNSVWIWYINQYDFESYGYSQDGEGVNIIGDSNGVEYNGAESEKSPED